MIIIPMAGMSSRFFQAGFKKPKYMLETRKETLFEHSVNSFKEYFSTLPFLFIVKDSFNTPEFVYQKAKQLKIKEFYISILDSDTRGQAESVALGLEKLENQGIRYSGPITIFNIDTFRPGFKFPDFLESCDGYLEVFRGRGENWSFAKPKDNHSSLVIQTAEKKPISDLCSTGLYYFTNKVDFLSSYNEYLSLPVDSWEKGELYIAPLYNILIRQGKIIKYHKIEESDVIFCGTPEEYKNIENKV